MGKRAGGWDIQEMVGSYLNKVWPPHLILHPVLLSQRSLSVSYPDYPPSVPSLLSRPASLCRTDIVIFMCKWGNPDIMSKWQWIDSSDSLGSTRLEWLGSTRPEWLDLSDLVRVIRLDWSESTQAGVNRLKWLTRLNSTWVTRFDSTRVTWLEWLGSTWLEWIDSCWSESTQVTHLAQLDSSDSIRETWIDSTRVTWLDSHSDLTQLKWFDSTRVIPFEPSDSIRLKPSD